MDSYMGALAAGDSVAAGRCWARESLQRSWFWQSLHIGIGYKGDITALRNVLATDSAVVTGVRPVPDTPVAAAPDAPATDAWQLDFEWRPRAGNAAAALSDPPPSMHYYVTRQDDHFVFINPIDLLTRPWGTHREGFCVFHYPERLSSNDAAMAMEFMDARCREVADYLGSDLDSIREIDVYVADSAKTVGELILFPPSGGYCVTERRLVISPTFVNPHEVVHLLARPHGHSLVNGPISEGIAVALGGTHSSTPEFCLAQTRNFLDDSLYVAIPDLIEGEERAFFDNPEVTYLEAGAWVKFLLDRYGYSKLVEWDGRCRSGTSTRTAFQDTYGSTEEDLDAPWKQYLAGYDLPSVGTRVPANAELVFSMDDPAGDDDADGTYRYPTDPRFRKGVLDLRKLQVLRDDRNAYFRLEFAEAGRPVRDEATGHCYTPGAIIALQRGSHASRRGVSHSLERVTFEGDDGFDLQINVGTGIMVYDRFGRSIVASRAIRLSSGAGCGKAVEFSLPVSFIGYPSPEWKYFAGSVVMDDVALSYLRSYPEAVSGSEAPFAISGRKTPAPPPFMDILLPAHLDQKALLGDVAPMASSHRRAVPLLREEGVGRP